MLDGNAYQAHVPDDPAYGRLRDAGAPRLINSASLLAALSALEDEFRTILKQDASATE